MLWRRRSYSCIILAYWGRSASHMRTQPCSDPATRDKLELCFNPRFITAHVEFVKQTIKQAYNHLFNVYDQMKQTTRNTTFV